ncbi:MAG: MFS transporter [Coriobacteriia bacterium]
MPSSPPREPDSKTTSAAAARATVDDENACTGADRIALEEADIEAPPQAVVRRGGTFESFRERDFTLFWFGSLVSNTGTWMQTTALALVVFSFRQSSIDLGVVNFVSGIPILFLALPAGALADRVDKRMLLIIAQAVLMLQAAALGILYYQGRLSSVDPVTAMVWVSALGLLGGVMSALTFPAWQALLPDLVPRDKLMNAIALNSAQFQSSRLLGPLVTGGFVLIGASFGNIFMLNAASFLFVIAALWAIKPHPESESAGHSRPHGAPTESAWARLTAGVSYAREDRTVGALIVSTAFMTVFAMPYMMLLPAIVHSSLGATGQAEQAQVSWLMAANGLGAAAGALIVASMPTTTRRERLIPVAIIAMGALLVAFALSHNFWLSIPLSVLAGAAFLTVNSLTNTSIQAAVPGRLRGRVMALFVMAFMGIMPISAAVFGPIAQAVGPSEAVLAGAVVLMGWGIFLLVTRALTRGLAENNQA